MVYTEAHQIDDAAGCARHGCTLRAAPPGSGRAAMPGFHILAQLAGVGAGIEDPLRLLGTIVLLHGSQNPGVFLGERHLIAAQVQVQ